jgi:hypothetical protein
MKRLSTFILLTVLANGPGRAEIADFDDLKIGAPPPGWIATQTGKGDAKWAVVADDSAPSKPNVLKQSGTADYPVCFKRDASIKDGFVEVKFKSVAGIKDQAGGVVWRCKDADNYYIARANALEDNVTLYKIIQGKRSVLDIFGRKGGYGVREKVAAAQWHTLRVEFHGNRFRLFFDGKHLFDVEDDTFTDAGSVGIWTKADSVTLFDDFAAGASDARKAGNAAGK